MGEQNETIRLYGSPDGSLYYFDENGEIVIYQSFDDSYHVLDKRD